MSAPETLLSQALKDAPHLLAKGDAHILSLAQEATKKLYDQGGVDVSYHPLFPPAELEHLVVDHMGPEQIWQQLELRNTKLARVLEHVISNTEDAEDEDEDTDEDDAQPDAMDDEDAWVDEDDEDEDEDEDEGFAGASDFSDLDPNEVFYEPLHNEQEQVRRKKAKEREEMMRMYGVSDPALVDALVTSAEDEDEKNEEETSAPKRPRHPTLDDDFFSIDEFNRMTEAEERRMQTQAANLSGEEPDVDFDEEIDLFAPVDDGDESEEDAADSMSAADIMYKDFFDPVPGHRKEPAKASAKKPEPPRRTLVRFHDQVRVRPIKQSKSRRAAAVLTDRPLEEDGIQDDDDEDDEEEDEKADEEAEEEDEEDEEAEEEDEEDEEDAEEDEEEDEDEEDEEDEGIDEEEVEGDVTLDDDAQADATAQRVAQDLFADEAPEPTSELSSHERHLAELSEAIARYEDENVREKDWTLMGEASSRERPANSLLQEDLEFERTAKAAPIQTQEHTEGIDAMIRRRILERQYDDVVRQRDVEALPFSASNLLELSDAKSAKSLAELYEDEYQAARGTDAPSEAEARLDHDRTSLATDIEAFFSTLDALSNAHYTPKAPKAAIQTISNTPALQMESALPTTLSTGTMLAPEEVYETPAQAPALVGAASEQSHAEKQRLHHQRRHAKRQKRERRQRAEAALERSSGAPRRGTQSEKDQALKSLVGNKGVTVVGKDSKRRSVKDAVAGRRPTSSSATPPSGAAWKL
ncbi:U3 snoRNP protein [Malassezia caprae]|uniref:U3 small nucleolar ribonucleoprotein protein MPP10 n=1 Tax=Malassezia caprae TaxID=1381934 RepID=A0AAF0IWF4_9BASI|nr:U3 snoRNP protein [Malassezia caprae]